MSSRSVPRVDHDTHDDYVEAGLPDDHQDSVNTRSFCNLSFEWLFKIKISLFFCPVSFVHSNSIFTCCICLFCKARVPLMESDNQTHAPVLSFRAGIICLILLYILLLAVLLAMGAGPRHVSAVGSVVGECSFFTHNSRPPMAPFPFRSHLWSHHHCSRSDRPFNTPPSGFPHSLENTC